MHKPIWSWTNTLARLGFTRRRRPHSRTGPHCRRLQIERLEQRHLLSGDLAAVAFYSDADDLTVRYNVAEEDVRPFDIAIYSSADKLRPEKLLDTWRINDPDDRAVGMHQATKSLDLSAMAADHFLIAVVDAHDKVAEAYELNNQLLFQGGIIDTPQGSAHVLRPPGQGGAAFDPARAPLWTLGGYWAEQAAGGEAGPMGGTRSVGGPPGQLDPEFNGDGDNDGIIITHVPDTYLNAATAVAVQDDGKIVVAGYGWTLSTYTFDFAVLRYNDDGSPDNSFGTGGVSHVDFDDGQYSGNDYAFDVAIDSNGKIVVAGYGTDASGTYDYLALARLNTDGGLDDGSPQDITPGDSFGTGGRVRDDQIPGGRPVWGSALAIDDQDQIVVAGVAQGTADDFLLVRYLYGGARDTSFGDPVDQGIVLIDFFGYNDTAWGVIIDSNENIVVAGETYTGSSVDMAVARYDSNGLPDGSFGPGGIRSFDFAAGRDAAYDVAIDSDGKIVVAGRAYMGASDYDFALARLTTGGILDDTFGKQVGQQRSGKQTTDFSGGADAAKGVAISPDGRIVLAGYAYNGSNDDFGLARYNPDGNLDLTFGAGGKVTTPRPGTDYNNGAEDLAIDAEHRIVAVGTAYTANDYDIMLARYLPGKTDIEITGFRVDPTHPDPQAPTYLEVSYQIWNEEVESAFEMALYASADGLPLGLPLPAGRVLMTQQVTSNGWTLGPHTLSIAAAFEPQPTVYDLDEDYFLMVKADSAGSGPNGQIDEEVESNNDGLFDGGIFRDATSNIVHVHGADPAPYAERDLVVLEVDATDYTVHLYDPDGFGQQPPISRQTAVYDKTLVSEFHVRTHDGDDDVLTPNPALASQVSDVEVPIWAFGGLGGDLIYGGDAEDSLDPEFRDRLYGGPGDDEIAGRLGPDTIYGEQGDDSLEGWAGNDMIYGGPGNDRIEGWSGQDELYGEAGDDIILGGPGDAVVGNDLADTIYGGPGDDRIDGWQGDDVIYGDDATAGPGDGNDEIYGFDGNDIIHGGGGHDNLFGEEGDDQLFGEDGDDLLKGRNDIDLGAPDQDIIDGGAGTNFLADTQIWPDQLPWPELNLVADVTSDVFVDDGGRGFDSTNTPATQWETEQNPQAFNGSQSVLDVQGDPGNPPSVGLNAGTWWGTVWTQEADVYVTWVPRVDAAQNAPFEVFWGDGTLLTPQPIRFNQQNPPPADLIVDGRPYAKLGTFANHDGLLKVHLSDKQVAVGQFIIADAVLVQPVQGAPGSEARPGSWANREENGFFQGVLLQMDSPDTISRKVDLRVEDPNNDLIGKRLQLNFEGDGTVIEVYKDAAMTQRIYSGDTWDIGQITEIYVKGVGAGTTELVLTLEEPILDERPLSDILVVNVNQ